MQVKLIVKKGTKRARVVNLQSAETIIGRRHDCDLRILSSQVSRRHCLLSIHEGVLSVEDLDSVNGTFVNGKRVAGKQTLHPNDVLEIGPLRFAVDFEPTDEALEVLPVAGKNKPGNDFVFNDDDEELDALPVVDEDTELLKDKGSLATVKDDGDDDIPLAEDAEVGDDWQLPQAGDLRSILTEMDEGKAKPKRKGK
jgi:predicted component of type VI protein secretion system